jgi:DNA polymerase II large subunit
LREEEERVVGHRLERPKLMMQNAPTRGKRRLIVVEGRIDTALEKTEEAIATYSHVKEYLIIHFLISSLL